MMKFLFPILNSGAERDRSVWVVRLCSNIFFKTEKAGFPALCCFDGKVLFAPPIVQIKAAMEHLTEVQKHTISPEYPELEKGDNCDLND